MKMMNATCCLGLALLAPLAWTTAMAEQRQENFDKDPDWDGHNNRSGKPETIRQDFGWSPGTTNAGGIGGEIGGRIHPAAEPAYYARRIVTRTFNDVLSASGTLKVEPGGGHTLIGFFDARALNEWRTPNTIALRIQQRGDFFHCHLEHCTSKWRAGAGIIGRYDKARDRMEPKALPCGQVWAWSLKYDPNGSGGNGVVTATLDGETASYEVSPQHKADGAEFNHFGLVNVMKQFDGSGALWLDHVTINGEREEFGRDPKWDASGNRRTYETRNVRPRFDFGFTDTHHAGGKAAGELGGLFFRGDCRYGERLAAYGDRLALLALDRPLRASGKLCLRRGVSDSTTLIGFYHSTNSLSVNPSQQFSTPKDFMGAAIEGPSGEGFHFYPVYRNHSGGASSGTGANPPRIYPDSAAHEWTIEYDPAAANGNGRITVSLDGKAMAMDLAPGVQAAGAQFDRFGLVTPWIDGNGQHVYFDDLSYTCRQE
ncbi:MAG TPA: hypothetical protein VGK40_10755 [Verrucomicrobiae bacterium]|jgi:hypothetical protein